MVAVGLPPSFSPTRTESAVNTMNFPKLVVIVAVAAVAIGSFVYFTRVDRSNPAEVAAAFTKAMKKQDTKTAADYYMPDQAEAWKSKMDTKIDGMKSGTFTSYFENIPADLPQEIATRPHLRGCGTPPPTAEEIAMAAHLDTLRASALPPGSVTIKVWFHVLRSGTSLSSASRSSRRSC